MAGIDPLGPTDHRPIRPTSDASTDPAAPHLARLLDDIPMPAVLAAPEVGARLGRRGTPLGRYLVLEELGSGGMGTVFKAYDDALERAVAIKVLHPEAAEHNAVRLRREARALAKLSHPNVVHVYEVGRTDDHWYISMELVSGQTLREWNDTPRGWQECVDVYGQLGAGLAAAHATGLVHRDFKPDNCIIDATGRPRVLDFGLVSGTLRDTLDETAVDLEGMGLGDEDVSLTTSGMLMGTPAYMSIEQLDGREADPRSDQFSFCVSLYEALHGKRPYDGSTLSELREAIFLEDVGRLPKGSRIPTRLHAILCRGLAADPSHRWPSMDELLASLQAVARPRARRWLGLSLFGGLMATGGGLAWYAEVGQRCEGAARELYGVWDDDRRRELKSAIMATELPYASETWSNVIEPGLDDYAQRWVGQHQDACEATSIRGEQSSEILDLRMACLHRAKVQLDAVVRVFRAADADVVDHAADVVAGLRTLDRCADPQSLRDGELPPQAHELAVVDDLRARLATSRAELSAGHPQTAKAELESIREQLVGIEYVPVVIEVGLGYAQALQALGLYGEAERVYLEAFATAAEQRRLDDLRQIATELINVVGNDQRRIEEALRYRELALGLSAGDPIAEAAARNSVANVLQASGRYDEAGLEYRRVLELSEGVLGSDSPRIMMARSNLAAILHLQGEFTEAEAEHRRTLAVRRRILGDAHPQVASSFHNLAVVLHSMGRNEDARAALETALQIRARSLGADNPDTADTHNGLAVVLMALGRFDQALSHFDQAAKVWTRTLGLDHPHVAGTHMNLALIFERLGDLVRAEQEVRIALGSFERSLGSDHPQVAIARLNLAAILLDRRDLEQAERYYGQAASSLERALGPSHPHVATAQTGLAKTLVELGRAAEAVPIAERAWQRRRQGDVPAESRADTAFLLARASWTAGTDPLSRQQARTLASEALTAYRAAGEAHHDEAEQVRRWLERHSDR